MGVFDAMTQVVLEAGRLDDAERCTVARKPAPERAWRLRLAYVPVMGALLLLFR